MDVHALIIHVPLGAVVRKPYEHELQLGSPCFVPLIPRRKHAHAIRSYLALNGVSRHVFATECVFAIGEKS